MELTGVGRQPRRHEVLQLGDAVFVQKARYQDVGGRPIKLLVPYAIITGGNLEPASLCIIQDSPENTGRIKVRVAVPVDRTIPAYQRNGVHIADDSVIFDRLIRHRYIPSRVSKN